MEILHRNEYLIDAIYVKKSKIMAIEPITDESKLARVILTKYPYMFERIHILSNKKKDTYNNFN